MLLFWVFHLLGNLESIGKTLGSLVLKAKPLSLLAKESSTAAERGTYTFGH